MTVPAYTKFELHAFIENEVRNTAGAKPAEAAKAPDGKSERSTNSATLAALAGGPAETQKFGRQPET